MATVLDVWRPTVPQTSATENDPSVVTDADYLLAEIDVFGDGRIRQSIKLAFSDHSGLQAEWETGTATTIVEAALASEWSSKGSSHDLMTAAQRLNLVSKSL